MAAPFHLLSNFNECRIVGRVYVRDYEKSDNQPEYQEDAAPNSSGDDAKTTGLNTRDDAAPLSHGDDDEATPAEIVEREFVFPSAEHYWWAHFTPNAADVSRLAVGGDLATLEDGLRLLLGPQLGAQKAKFWRKKGNVGIAAKMLAAGGTNNNKRNESNGSTPSCASETTTRTTAADGKSSHRHRAKNLGMELGLHPLPQYGGQGEMATLRAIWKKIQTEKYTQNEEHRRVLTSTGSEALVEFVRMRPEGHTWGGQVRGGVKRSKGLKVGGELVGGNFMGECLMAVRASL